MGVTRTGTVGYHYRDWCGVFYPANSSSRRQFQIYSQNFSVCELTQFTHQMPDVERMSHFAAQAKSDIRFFVRIHNAFTHCADVGLALTIAKHFRKALEPLHAAGKLAGLVAPFPYAFKNSEDSRNYIEQLAKLLSYDNSPLQLDFRHPSWLTESCQKWIRDNGLGLVLVDEPQIAGLLPSLSVGLSSKVMVRFHGRNAEGWWSGNNNTRFDYSYSDSELFELVERYRPLVASDREVFFIFSNHWQAQAATNALRWKEIVQAPLAQAYAAPEPLLDEEISYSEDSGRPPTSLPISELKSRVSRALFDPQTTFDLTPRGEFEEPI